MTLYKSLGDSLAIKWHVRNASAIVVGPACQSYIDHHLNVSLNEEPIYTVISSIPCERLWPWLGMEINSQTHHYGPYADWINKSFSPLYTGYTKLEAFVNDAYAKGQVDKDKALQIYAKSMEAEAAFFNSIQA
ncbi:uncharacterized protein LOC143063354 [Mytilus galloprovincialis]|uniref:uncharacterized protein LOC143063354 n=1 Tax=Mytilus galloprovincialis TaxID=29158 RepID=UPI003F7BEE1D